MLNRLSETYGISIAALTALSIGGLVAFATVIGLSVFSGTVTLWPEMPLALAISLAIFAPLLFVVGVGVACATHDKWATDPKMAKKLKLLKMAAPAAAVAYLVFVAVRTFR